MGRGKRKLWFWQGREAKTKGLSCYFLTPFYVYYESVNLSYADRFIISIVIIIIIMVHVLRCGVNIM